jgi:ribosomal protein S12 methylthiotransferase
MNDILPEAELLAESGVKELLVIAQDTSSYGIDLDKKTNIVNLAQELSKLGIWIRLHYLYPHPCIDKLIQLMATNKILPYLDMPLQHAHPRILKLMQRPSYKNNMLENIKKWRATCPDLSIRSTFIVGFPGETDEEFAYLLNFLAEAKIDRVGCFKYSPVKGAKANELPNQIPEPIKEERLETLMDLQAEISTQKLATKIGKTIEVIIDEITEDAIIGRSKYDSPKVDGQVIIKKNPNLKPGDIIKVKIDKADEHDLFGRIA